jgi:hypothetical protein
MNANKRQSIVLIASGATELAELLFDDALYRLVRGVRTVFTPSELIGLTFCEVRRIRG